MINNMINRRTLSAGFVLAFIATASVPLAAGSVAVTPSSSGNDTSRIQQAIDNSTGEVHFAAGSYVLRGPLHLRGSQTYSGEGSWDSRRGSVLVQQVTGSPIFSVDGLVSSVTITGLAFDGISGASARGIAGSSAQAVLADSIVRDSFLAECIDVAMQATRIEHNSFGLNGGSIGPKHRHTHTVSAGEALETNANWIVGNHFSQAQGGESVLFENGAKLHIEGNDFQGNAADTTLSFLRLEP